MHTSPLASPIRKVVGEIDDAPHKLDEACWKITPTMVAQRIWRDRYGKQPPRDCPGICRFCGRSLPVTHTRVQMTIEGPPMEYPELQCDYVAQMWENADEIIESKRRELKAKWKAEQEREKAMAAQRAKEANDWDYSDF